MIEIEKQVARYQELHKQASNLAAENQKLAAEVEQWKELASQAEQAIYFTREYVGEHMLPAIAGWSWYDTSVAITQALVAQEPERCATCRDKKRLQMDSYGQGGFPCPNCTPREKGG